MPSAQKIITVHDGVGPELLDRILSDLEEALEDAGATRVWVDPAVTATTVMAMLPVNAPACEEAPAPAEPVASAWASHHS